MADLPERIIPDLKPQQIVEDHELDDEFNNIYYWLKRILPAMMVKNADGRVEINCLDALTLGGSTLAEIVAGQYPGLQEAQADMLSDFILEGGAATKNGSTANRADVTAITALFKDTSNGKIVRKTANATNFTTSAAASTYYLDFTAGGVLNFATTHPATQYLPVARVTTDASANISLVTDLRELTPQLLPGADAKVDLSNTADLTIDDTVTADVGSIVTLLFRLYNLLKGVTGKPSAITAPATTLEAAKAHIDNVANPHATTYTQVGASPAGHGHYLVEYAAGDALSTNGPSGGADAAAVYGLWVNNLTVTFPQHDYPTTGSTLQIPGRKRKSVKITQINHSLDNPSFDYGSYSKISYQVGAGAEVFLPERFTGTGAGQVSSFTENVNIGDLSNCGIDITIRQYIKNNQNAGLVGRLGTVIGEQRMQTV